MPNHGDPTDNALAESAEILYNMDTMLPRLIKKQILKYLKPGRVAAILGARRTGKTVLMEQLKRDLKNRKILMVTGDNLDAAEILASRRLSVLEKLTAGYDTLFVDEAQSVPNIGSSLKLLADSRPGLSILVSGSSSFDLKNKIGEPLTGRIYFFHLHPLAQVELKETEDFLKTRALLDDKLIYGLYPQVFTASSAARKRKELESIRDTYLLKDILSLDNLKDSLFVLNLLRLIAFQIGNDISYSELAVNLGVNKKTVIRYLELLEKTYILFSLRGFSRNLRKEYTRTPRYYFWDNGIRNVVVSNFNPLNLRDDIGRLWENYCISERLKKLEYAQTAHNRYFWRTYDQKEIDFVEERAGWLHGYEFKWRADKSKPPKDFMETYRGSRYLVVNRDNYLDFVA